MGIESAVAVQQAMLRQNASLAMIRQAADVQQQVASLLEQSVATVPASPNGALVNISA